MNNSEIMTYLASIATVKVDNPARCTTCDIFPIPLQYKGLDKHAAFIVDGSTPDQMIIGFCYNGKIEAVYTQPVDPMSKTFHPTFSLANKEAIVRNAPPAVKRYMTGGKMHFTGTVNLLAQVLSVVQYVNMFELAGVLYGHLCQYENNLVRFMWTFEHLLLTNISTEEFTTLIESNNYAMLADARLRSAAQEAPVKHALRVVE